MNFINQFKTICTLYECCIEIYDTHIKIKLSCNVNNSNIILYYNIHKQYNTLQYNYIVNNLNGLQTKIPCIIYKNDEELFTTDIGDTKIFCSGNISQKNNRIYFNTMYLQIVDNNYDEYIEIHLSGVPISNNQIVTKLNDNAKMFYIKNDLTTYRLYNMKLKYNLPIELHDNIITTKQLDKYDKLSIEKYRVINTEIDENEINVLLTEIEIENSWNN